MKRGVKIVEGFFNIQEISKENIYIFIILLCLFISYILRGLAFKKLLNNYFGFIPIAGDLICMSKIIEKIKENYKRTLTELISYREYLKEKLSDIDS